MELGILRDLLIIIAAGFLAGLICRRLGAPMVVGYLVAGVLLGRGAAALVGDEGHEIEHLAQAGALLLLFSIGLEFSLEELVALRRHLFVGGTVQMLLVAIPVAVFSVLLLDTSWRVAVLIGSAAALSSTVLVFKALSEWGQTASPPGRRAICILLFQDIALVPLLLMIPLLTGKGEASQVFDLALLAVTSMLSVIAVWLLQLAIRRWLVPLLADLRSTELVILFTLVVLGGMTMAAHAVGLPPALGAFAAGLVFSGNRLTGQVDALVLPFRESFAALFFVSLGLLLDPRVIWSEARLILPGLVAVLLLKSAAAAVALRFTGLRWKPALGMGIGLAQLGEFSFVLVLEGWNAGLLGEADYRRMLCFAIGTLMLTPALLKRGVRWSLGAGPEDEAEPATAATVPPTRSAVVIGIGPVGRQVASQLETQGVDVCLVDLSPVNLYGFAQVGFRTVAGDGSDPEVLVRAQVEHSQLVAICVPDDDAAMRTLRAVRLLNTSCRIMVRCRFLANRGALKKAGADDIAVEEAEVSVALLKSLTNESEWPLGHQP